MHHVCSVDIPYRKRCRYVYRCCNCQLKCYSFNSAIVYKTRFVTPPGQRAPRGWRPHQLQNTFLGAALVFKATSSSHCDSMLSTTSSMHCNASPWCSSAVRAICSWCNVSNKHAHVERVTELFHSCVRAAFCDYRCQVIPIIVQCWPSFVPASSMWSSGSLWSCRLLLDCTC